VEVIKWLIGIFGIMFFLLLFVSREPNLFLGLLTMFMWWLGWRVYRTIVDPFMGFPNGSREGSTLPKIIFVLYCLVVLYLVMSTKPANSSYPYDQY
jgi:hypothetical protein